ncbi:MAG: hypothetical protein HYZ28_01935 [Myxococcales bacterium]|nr:hypothetical protein [Myxococcales bacterium]
MPSIRRMGEQFAADRAITVDEAKALVEKAKSNGVVSGWEKAQLRNIVRKYADVFQPGALDVLKPLIDTQPPPPPPAATEVTNLNPSGSHRPIFLGSNGVFTSSANGAPPRDDVERGDAMFRAAELVDDSKDNVLSRVPQQTRAAAFEQLKLTLSRVPSGGQPPEGLNPQQALQMRASTATVLLHLIEASPEPELRGQMAKTYEGMVKAETDPRLRENLIFHLANSPAAQTGEVKAIADVLMKELAPTTPPYEKWFANGNKTVNLSWTVGQGEFWKGFTNNLKQNGFRAVGPENQHGTTVYEKTTNKPGVGETTFRINVREGGSNILGPVNDPSVHVVGYDGHSNWGRNMTSSVRNGPETQDGGDGKLLFYNLCVGKGVLDRVREKYPNLQVATTYAASNFYTDGQGQMTRGEGVQALLAMVDGISERAPWSTIHQRMNDAADIGWGRTWDNYVTPISTLVREKVLDRDHDGQADYLDKHFNYDTFKVAEDTAREFTPVRQSRPAGLLDGTKVLVAGNMINTLSEFSSILDRVNPDSKVIPTGWFEPKMGEREVVRFTQERGADGKPELRMQVNARYAHMSEESLRATTIYEFNRYLSGSGQLRMDPVDAKLAGLIAFAQSLRVDEGYRDGEVWKSFLSRYNLPPDLSLSAVTSLLTAEHHHYAGSPEMVQKFKQQLSPQILEQLRKPEVGEPVQLIG